MKWKTKYKIALWNMYFQKGLSFTSQLKYIIAGFGAVDILVNQRWWLMTSLFAAYIISCFIVGKIWIKHMLTAEIEVGNTYNKFVKYMKKRVK